MQFSQDEIMKEAKTNDLLIPESDTEMNDNPELPDCSVCLYRYVYALESGIDRRMENFLSKREIWNKWYG